MTELKEHSVVFHKSDFLITIYKYGKGIPVLAADDITVSSQRRFF